MEEKQMKTNAGETAAYGHSLLKDTNKGFMGKKIY